jgi:hypothetical protein
MKLSSFSPNKLAHLPPEQMFLGIMLCVLVVLSFMQVKEGFDVGALQKGAAAAMTTAKAEPAKEEKKKEAFSMFRR